MKILFISEYYPPKVMGGGEINVALIAEELSRQKHEVLVLTSKISGFPKEEISKGVIVYRRVKTGRSASTLWGNFQRRFFFPHSLVREAIALITEKSPDIVHCIGTSIIAAPEIKKYCRTLFATVESYPALCPKGDRLYHGTGECKTICTLKKFLPCQKDSAEIGKMENKWYFKYNPLFLWLVYRQYQQLNNALFSCRLVAISSYVQSLLQHHALKSVVVPNAFDAAPFSATCKTSKNSIPVVIYVGALLRSKGPQVLVEALKGIPCRCELYGEGILKEQLQRAIKRDTIDAEIFPPLPYEKMPEVYTKADVIVFPSLWPEPFGRVPLEAMAARKPLIASDTGAIPSIVNKETILVPPGDSRALHKALTKVLSDRCSYSEPSLANYHCTIIAKKLSEEYKKEKEKFLEKSNSIHSCSASRFAYRNTNSINF